MRDAGQGYLPAGCYTAGKTDQVGVVDERLAQAAVSGQKTEHRSQTGNAGGNAAGQLYQFRGWQPCSLPRRLRPKRDRCSQ